MQIQRNSKRAKVIAKKKKRNKIILFKEYRNIGRDLHFETKYYIEKMKNLIIFWKRKFRN